MSSSTPLHRVPKRPLTDVVEVAVDHHPNKRFDLVNPKRQAWMNEVCLMLEEAVVLASGLCAKGDQEKELCKILIGAVDKVRNHLEIYPLIDIPDDSGIAGTAHKVVCQIGQSIVRDLFEARIEGAGDRLLSACLNFTKLASCDTIKKSHARALPPALVLPVVTWTLLVQRRIDDARSLLHLTRGLIEASLLEEEADLYPELYSEELSHIASSQLKVQSARLWLWLTDLCMFARCCLRNKRLYKAKGLLDDEARKSLKSVLKDALPLREALKKVLSCLYPDLLVKREDKSADGTESV